MNTNLTPELQKQIIKEANSSAANFHYYPGSEQFEDMGSAYETGAFKYAEKWQEAEQKIKELTQWKKEATLLLGPLLEWEQAQKDIPLGYSITRELLRRAKLCTEAEQRAERYEKALREIKKGLNWIENSRELDIIHEALTPKTTTDGSANG